MNRKKNKKIRKELPAMNKPSNSANQPQIQENIEPEANQIEQQQTTSQAIFQQPTNEDALENDQQINNQITNSQMVALPKCELSTGWMFALNRGEYYWMINKTMNTARIAIIDGSVNINAKIYTKLFGIKCNSNLVVTPGQKENNLDQDIQEGNTKSKGNYKQKILQKNKVKYTETGQRQQIKEKQRNTKNISQKQSANQQMKCQRRNIEQILNKIKNNIYIVQANKKKFCKIVDEAQKIEEDHKKSQITISEKVKKFLVDYKSLQKTLIWTDNEDISITKCQQPTKPWETIEITKYIGNGERTLLIGIKNTGKSTFCSYLENHAQIQNTQICIIDLDIGRNRIYPGCISLSYIGLTQQKQCNSIWIGEYTPLNSTSFYIKAIHAIYQYYKEKYFTVSLIVNTMGYLTGLGELILYEIFNIIKPQKVLFLQNPNTPQHFIINTIENNIKSGKYTERLYFKQSEHCTKTSTNIEKYTNYFSRQKSTPSRFQSLISKFMPKSIEDLIFLILSRKMIHLSKRVRKFRGSKEGNLYQMDEKNDVDTNMRLVILGQLWRDSYVLVKGVGFIWDNSIFYDPLLIKQQQISIALFPDGIDFERSFYQISQSKMIEIELGFGCHLPYISPIFKGLGNKGMRYNPAKKILSNRV